MIDWCRRCVCDNCDIVSGAKNPVTSYTFRLKRVGRDFTLCEKCVKELSESLQEIISEEGIE